MATNYITFVIVVIAIFSLVLAAPSQPLKVQEPSLSNNAVRGSKKYYQCATILCEGKYPIFKYYCTDDDDYEYKIDYEYDCDKKTVYGSYKHGKAYKNHADLWGKEFEDYDVYKEYNIFCPKKKGAYAGIKKYHHGYDEGYVFKCEYRWEAHATYFKIEG